MSVILNVFLVWHKILRLILYSDSLSCSQIKSCFLKKQRGDHPIYLLNFHLKLAPIPYFFPLYMFKFRFQNTLSIPIRWTWIENRHANTLYRTLILSFFKILSLCGIDLTMLAAAETTNLQGGAQNLMWRCWTRIGKTQVCACPLWKLTWLVIFSQPNLPPRL